MVLAVCCCSRPDLIRVSQASPAGNRECASLSFQRSFFVTKWQMFCYHHVFSHLSFLSQPFVHSCSMYFFTDSSVMLFTDQ